MMWIQDFASSRIFFKYRFLIANYMIIASSLFAEHGMRSFCGIANETRKWFSDTILQRFIVIILGLELAPLSITFTQIVTLN